MLSRDSDNEFDQDLCLNLLIWPQEVTLIKSTQPSGLLCLWQCFEYFFSKPTTLFSILCHFCGAHDCVYLQPLLKLAAGIPRLSSRSAKISHSGLQENFLIPEILTECNKNTKHISTMTVTRSAQVWGGRESNAHCSMDWTWRRRLGSHHQHQQHDLQQHHHHLLHLNHHHYHIFIMKLQNLSWI